MTDDLEFRRATADWLTAGSDRTPPVLIDAVLLAVRTTPQERDLPIPWRNHRMPKIIRAAILAAAIGVVAVAWFGLSLVPGGSGGPGRTPSPAPTSTPIALEGGGTVFMPPGRYRIFSYGTTAHAIDITISGDGWTSYGDFAADKNGRELVGVSFVDWDITTKYAEPCTDHTPIALPTDSPGSFVGALANQPEMTAGPIRDVTIDGHSGKSIELTEHLGTAVCPADFWAFGTGAIGRVGAGDGETVRVYAVDVDGAVRTFFLRIPAWTTASDEAELEAVVASAHLVP